MSWNTPKTWSYKEAPGSDSLNEQLRDNLTYLKASLPAGVIIGWGAVAAPAQWLLCDGSAVSRTTYEDLFNAIGTSYGVGNGSTTFNLPDYRRRAMVGYKSGDSDFGTMGQTGGASTHTLSEAEMPSHNHTWSGTTSGQSATHTHGIAVRGTAQSTGSTSIQGDASGGTVTLNTGNASADHTHTYSGTTSSKGSGSAHNNLQPYQVSSMIIKY